MFFLLTPLTTGNIAMAQAGTLKQSFSKSFWFLISVKILKVDGFSTGFFFLSFKRLAILSSTSFLRSGTI
jgi:hypothetical protein